MADQTTNDAPEDAVPPVTSEPDAPAATAPTEEPRLSEADIKSEKVTLADLSAKGDSLYTAKKYEEASEFFSEASNLQAELNGETAPENAEILFRYGRCLFKVGQSKSNVLGGKAPNVQSKGSKKPAKPSGKGAGSTSTAAAATSRGKVEDHVNIPDAKKPLFSFTGDENFDTSDDEDEDEGGGEEGDQEEQEEDEDDLSIAFEILDLARVCYLKQLDQSSAKDDTEADKGKETSQVDSPTLRHIKERLADTHDCLAEISLENEKYPNAIEDGRQSLNYKLGLYAEESEIIAEAHYKLSLALEFASVTTSDGEGTKREDMDQGLRDEAVKEMELAIKSFKLKLQNKEVELATMASPEENDLARKAIAEMKEVIADMDQRLTDLKDGPIDAKGLLGDGTNPLGGLLGAVEGESASETKSRVEEATKTAVDLTNLVRKKKPKDAGATEAATDAINGSSSGAAVEEASSHKRKASATRVPGSPKKAKVEDA